MLRKFGLLAMLVVLGFGVVGLAQSDPDDSVPYPSPPSGGEAELLQTCGYE